MNLADEIRQQIEKNKGLKLAVGEINNHLSVIEGLVRKDIEERVDEAYQKGYKDCETRYCSFDACPNRQAEYQRGLDDAWEAAKKIFGFVRDGGIPLDEIGKIFGYAEDEDFCTADIIRHNTASEAIAKLKAYEEKQKDKIVVGDEVAFHHDDGRPDTVVVVTYIGQDGFIDGMDGRGTQYAHKNPAKWTKTGRHFNIASILEDMRND